ncbi:uncharacterized protein LOC112191872 isoform X1 [Rosa chinensis]|uniref:uncharacterized protein LOC112191872 isoform X1 n=1 Tax=Rosa chinensis TaxID=74649 RepID=UPI001AD8D50A|nr:uncharacterized protein LOC112191872 isoform X1 [Rosa chinensis]
MIDEVFQFLQSLLDFRSVITSKESDSIRTLCHYDCFDPLAIGLSRLPSTKNRLRVVLLSIQFKSSAGHARFLERKRNEKKSARGQDVTMVRRAPKCPLRVDIPIVTPMSLGLVKYAGQAWCDLSSLRWVSSGAAPLSKEVADEFRLKFPWVVEAGVWPNCFGTL